MEELQVQTKLEIDRQLLDMRLFHQWAGMEITNAEGMQICGERLGLIAAHRKKIEAQRDSVLKPLKQATRKFEELVREALRPLNTIDELLRNRLASYMDAQQRKLEEEARAKREAEIAAEKAKQAQAVKLAIATGSEAATEEANQRAENLARLAEKPVEVRQTLKLDNATVAQTLVWEWSVVDLAQVPKEFFILDEKKLNGIAKAFSKSPQEIPGIKFEQKTRLSVAS